MLSSLFYTLYLAAIECMWGSEECFRNCTSHRFEFTLFGAGKVVVDVETCNKKEKTFLIDKQPAAPYKSKLDISMALNRSFLSVPRFAVFKINDKDRIFTFMNVETERIIPQQSTSAII